MISIIAILAAMLMPAIQAAREAARRAQCISNQRQVALALINYESAKQAFPPLRAPLRPNGYAWGMLNTDKCAPSSQELTWVGFLLPFIEQNTAWSQINTMPGFRIGNIDWPWELFDLVIPVMQCKSSGMSSGDNRINYVVNGGPLNGCATVPVVDANGDPIGPTRRLDIEYGNDEREKKSEKMYTIFFDHLAMSGEWKNTDFLRWCKTRVSIDDISAMDGTSMTILLSENEDAGHWIWRVTGEPPTGGGTVDSGPVTLWSVGLSNNAVEVGLKYYPDDPGTTESHVAFCFPGLRRYYVGGSISSGLSNIASGEIPDYVPIQSGVDNDASPLFINEGRKNTGASFRYNTRTARPSSGHPGIVIAAYCDGSVRTLKDDMDKTLFVRLCRPGSGVILNPKDLD